MGNERECEKCCPNFAAKGGNAMCSMQKMYFNIESKGKAFLFIFIISGEKSETSQFEISKQINFQNNSWFKGDPF